MNSDRLNKSADMAATTKSTHTFKVHFGLVHRHTPSQEPSVQEYDWYFIEAATLDGAKRKAMELILKHPIMKHIVDSEATLPKWSPRQLTVDGVHNYVSREFKKLLIPLEQYAYVFLQWGAVTHECLFDEETPLEDAV